jgi:hypothetical protein
VFTETRSRLGWRTGTGRLAMRHQVGRLQAFDPDERARAGIELVRLGLARSADQLLDHLGNEFDHIVLSAIAAAVSEAPPEPKESSRAQELREWADAELERLAVEDAFMGPDAHRETYEAEPYEASRHDLSSRSEPPDEREGEPEHAETGDDEPASQSDPIPVEQWHEVVATEAERTLTPAWVEPAPADEWDDEPASEPEPERLAEWRFAPEPESAPVCEWRFEPVPVEAQPAAEPASGAGVDEAGPDEAGVVEAGVVEPEAVPVVAAVSDGAVEAPDDAPPPYICWRPPGDDSLTSLTVGNGHGHASNGCHAPEGATSVDEPVDEHDDDPVEAMLVEAHGEPGPEAVHPDEKEPETAYRPDEPETEYRFEARPAPEPGPEPAPFDQDAPPSPPRTLAERLKARTR